jgi:simple sugar transport system substrate-binding protein
MHQLRSLARLRSGIVILLLLMGACQPTGDRRPVVGILLTRDDLPAPLVRAGFEDAAARAGVRVILESAEGRLDREAQQVDRLIAARVRGLVLTPVSATGSLSTLKKAAEAGIPVVCLHTCLAEDMQSGIVSALVRANARDLGSATGDAALKLILGGVASDTPGSTAARVGILACGPDAGCTERRAGFLGRLRMLPHVEVVAETPVMPTDDAVAAARTMLLAHPETRLLWAADRTAAAGAVEAVKALGLAGQVAVLGIGLDERIALLLQDDAAVLQGVAEHFPYQLSFAALEAARSAPAAPAIPLALDVAPAFFARHDAAHAQEFVRAQGRVQPTPMILATPDPSAPSTCNTCNPDAHPVIPTP